MAIAVMTIADTSEVYAAKKQKTSKTTSAKNNTSSKKGNSSKSTSASKSNRRKSNTSKSAAKNKSVSAPATSAEAKRRQELTQKEIQQTKEKIRLNEEEIKTGLADLNRISSEIRTGQAKVSNLKTTVSSLQNEITVLNGKIDDNEKQLKRLRDEYLKAVKKMRLNGRNQSMIAFIFASDNFNQALRRMRYIRQFSKWKQNKSKEINALTESLSAEKKQLAQKKDAHTASLAQLSATQEQLSAQHQRQSQLIDGLKQNGSALQAHLAKKQSEANQLKSAIATLIAQEQAKAEAERLAREKAESERLAREKAEAERLAREKAEAERLAREKEESQRQTKEKEETERASRKKKDTEKTSKDKKPKDKSKDKSPKDKPARSKPTPAIPKKDSKSSVNEISTPEKVSFASLRGNLPRPVDGSWRVTNPFGRHSMPELPEVEYDNPGIDAEVAMGASVKSVAGGKVSGVYKLSGYGNVVIVNHGDYYTVYGNLSSTSVAVGSNVSTGQIIGVAAPDPDDKRYGSVHFELWHGREKQNPEFWLR